MEWKDDEELRGGLRVYVEKNFKRAEILDFVKKKFPQYKWSLRTLIRRLQYFKVNYIDYDTSLADVQAAVREEMNGPGSLLGYRALHKKIREVHGLKVPRTLVHDIMYEVDPIGLKRRGNVGKQKRPQRKGKFTSKASIIL